MSRQIIVIAHDIRSSHNVGSLLRTAEGLGVEKVYFTGYTPYPLEPDDSRLPHISAKVSRDIHKTALGAENQLPWEHHEDINHLLKQLGSDGYVICALEQSSRSISLPNFQTPDKVALLLGREVEGIDFELLKKCETILEIPMFGQKESFNVVQAAAMALYHMTFSGLK